MARVVFDPDTVSSRIVYHGLKDWTCGLKREGRTLSAVGVREVYSADRWKSARAGSRCEVQFLVR